MGETSSGICDTFRFLSVSLGKVQHQPVPRTGHAEPISFSFLRKQAELPLLRIQETVENISRLIAPKPPLLQSFDTQNMETNPSFAFSNYCSVLEMCLSHFCLPWEGGDVES